MKMSEESNKNKDNDTWALYVATQLDGGQRQDKTVTSRQCKRRLGSSPGL